MRSSIAILTTTTSLLAMSCILSTSALADAKQDGPTPEAKPAAPASKQPNIILLISDDQSWDGLSVRMDPQNPRSASPLVQTPNLEKLAAQGTRFSNAYAPAPVCSATRASILTGKSPGQLHWTKAGPNVRATQGYKLNPPTNKQRVDSAEATVAEMLKRAGYRTAHFGKWHLNSNGPGAHGYDVHDGMTGNEDAIPHKDPNPVDIFGMTERAEAFIDQSVAEKKPFFIQMSYYALHHPENANAATIEKYRQLSRRGRERALGMAALAEDLDTGVGQLIDYVDQIGLGDNTYVIYMSDNGGARSALRGGKGGLWEGGIRVPFIMRGPGIAANATQDTTIVGYDLLPTFVEMAGSEEAIPQGVEGGSFLPLATGKTDQVTRSKDFVTFHFPHYQGSDGPQSALIQGNMKLVENYDSGKVLLFDLSTDPGESQDLSLAQPQRAAELQRLMRTHLDEIQVGWPTQNPAYDPNRPASEQPDKVERPRRDNRGGGRGGGGGRGSGRGGRGGQGNQSGS